MILITSCNRQPTKSELLTGTWKYESTHDLRTENEKKESDYIPTSISFSELNPNIKFIADGKYQETNDNGIAKNGIWEIKNDSLIISTEVKIANNEEIFKNPVMKANIRFKTNESYYLYAGDYSIKSINQLEMELESEKEIHTYKKTK